METPRDRFIILADRFDIEPRYAMKVYDEILHPAYTAPGRHYHNLDHIVACLDTVERLCPENTEAVPYTMDTVNMALWFHDVVYDTQAINNEIKSSDKFYECFKEHITPEDCWLIQDAIESTKDHRYSNGDPVLAWKIHTVLDADLSILGADESQYMDYSKKIRQEYSFVLEEAYLVGRIKVLESFLKKKMFQTNAFAIYEAQAQSNIRAELMNKQIALGLFLT